MTRVVSLAISLAACGRSGFDADGGRDAVGDGGARPNVAFVTSGTTDGTFATPPLASADALCSAAAQSAGLPGTFVAWLSDSTTNAIDRLAGSRGWVRTDGLPFADTPNGIVTGELFNPLDVDEHGIVISLSDAVWTGTGADGHLGADCNDWTSSSATIGYSGRDLPDFTAAMESNYTCGTSQAHLYCFETGRVVPVAPVPRSGGRLAFLGRPRSTADASVGALDQLCIQDAQNNGLAGTFAAAVASDATSLSSRFTLDGRPWVRVDGTVVATTGGRLFDGTALASFVNQTADGAYDNSGGAFFSGATDPYTPGNNTDCSNWGDTGTGENGDAGDAHTTDTFWSAGAYLCSDELPVLCLQQ